MKRFSPAISYAPHPHPEGLSQQHLYTFRKGTHASLSSLGQHSIANTAPVARPIDSDETASAISNSPDFLRRSAWFPGYTLAGVMKRGQQHK